VTRGVTEAGAILVIEDDAGIRETLSDFLRSEGFRVDVARDGGEGLERIAAHRPDVVLVDLIMPGMNGRQFLARLRAEAATRSLPVVLMTGSRPVGETAAAADVVLQKPFELDELLAAVWRFRPKGTRRPSP
jgi:two-component system, OmpR family, response regulator MprA